MNKYNKISMFEENFANTIHNLQLTLILWLVRGLTLLGKITSLKTVVIPKLTIVLRIYLFIYQKNLSSNRIYFYLLLLGVYNEKKLGDYNGAVVLRRKEQK